MALLRSPWFALVESRCWRMWKFIERSPGEPHCRCITTHDSQSAFESRGGRSVSSIYQSARHGQWIINHEIPVEIEQPLGIPAAQLRVSRDSCYPSSNPTCRLDDFSVSEVAHANHEARFEWNHIIRHYRNINSLFFIAPPDCIKIFFLAFAKFQKYRKKKVLLKYLKI